MLVQVSDEQAAELEGYSELTGKPFDALVQEALADYIECVVSSRTEALVEKSASA